MNVSAHQISPGRSSRFAHTLTTALALGLAASSALAQNTTTQAPAPLPSPAPVVRKAPATPATQQQTPASHPPSSIGTAQAPSKAPTPILTQSFPVASRTTTAPKPTPAPGTTPKPTPPKPTTPKPRAPAAKPSAPAAAASGNAGPMNRNVIVLDAAHGSPDSGSRISDSIVEKDVTLALAFKMRSLLSARGFNVVMTRDSDAPTSSPGMPLSLDDRAGIANHARGSACLLLHATGSGTGVHLYTSELPPAANEAAQLPWLSAQAAWVAQSQKLEKSISTALSRAHIPLVASAASVRPVDSLTCPALVIELAPQSPGDASTINDAAYQQRIAEAIATSLVFWQNQAQPPDRAAPTSVAPTPAAPTTPTETQP